MVMPERKVLIPDYRKIYNALNMLYLKHMEFLGRPINLPPVWQSFDTNFKHRRSEIELTLNARQFLLTRQLKTKYRADYIGGQEKEKIVFQDFTHFSRPPLDLKEAEEGAGKMLEQINSMVFHYAYGNDLRVFEEEKENLKSHKEVDLGELQGRLFEGMRAMYMQQGNVRMVFGCDYVSIIVHYTTPDDKETLVHHYRVFQA